MKELCLFSMCFILLGFVFILLIIGTYELLCVIFKIDFDPGITIWALVLFYLFVFSGVGYLIF
tara:strand:- start:496 stop:684 length:189 start_codon:yes stop_codon:yes gene_type:complete